MVRSAGSRPALGLLLFGTAFGSAPALADVKDGVDAWTKGDYAAAVREWAEPAAKGDPDAQFNMAQAYRLGRGVDIDLAQAEALYAKAAAQGHLKGADNYGLLLFQRGARTEAMPYIEAAAARGDPRAQYLVGIAHFNGDLAAQDWRRAYALLTLANSSGLPQARGAIAQMDEFIPLEDRQAAQTLATTIKAEADARRARELAAVDLALANDAPTGLGPTQIPQLASARPVSSPDSAGADYTGVTPPAVPAPAAATSAASTKQASLPTRIAKGEWKIQLGVFGVAGNAEKLWNKLAGRTEIAGHERMLVKGARFTTLYAAEYATRAEATNACAALKRSGHDCLVTR